MKTVRMKIDPEASPAGRFDPVLLDTTGENEIAAQIAADDAESRQEAARFVRRVRRRLGLSQTEFSARIDVPIDTIRNWEQGKRLPTGAAKALLKILDKAPEAALRVLN
jgi:putative transcriptional regulator